MEYFKSNGVFLIQWSISNLMASISLSSANKSA
jgi:hypothetical protein